MDEAQNGVAHVGPGGTGSSVSHAEPTVLVVDDVDSNLRLLEAQLRSMRCKVLRASSGHEALRLMSIHAFAVVLLDAQMPQMDGFEVAKRARGVAPAREVPIIFLTGMTPTEESALRGYDIGAVDFLFKPVNPTILRSKVGVFLELYEARLRDVAAREQALELSAARQVTALKEALLAELQEKNDALERANVELEQFAYVASHDLRAPLRTVRVYTELLEQSLGQRLEQENLSYLKFVHDSAERLQNLVDDLLTYTRFNEDAPRVPLDMGQLVDELLSELCTPTECEAVHVERDDLPVVTASPTQIRQVMQNLLSNALKFRGTDPVRIDVRVSESQDDWMFTVSDNGIGIDPLFAERAFQIFQRYHPASEYPGSGLGLTIARGIILRHGGRIFAQPGSTGGTRVTFTLPRK